MIVLEQPRKVIETIIIVEGEIEEKQHSLIDEAREFSDLVFLFWPNIGIDPKKFTQLYRGCAYKVIDRLPETLMFTFGYGIEIFGHRSFQVARTRTMDGWNSGAVQALTMSGSISPVLIKSRSSCGLLKEIYGVREKKWWKSEPGPERGFSTYHSPSPVLFFKAQTLQNLLTCLEGEEDYIKTFTEKDPSYFLVSALDRFDIKILDKDIREIKFNGESV